MTTDEGQNLGAVAVLEDVTQLSELDRLKTEFIGVAAHELRTPVASLLLNLQLLEEGAVGELSDAQKELVRIQRGDLTRLEKLTAELLDTTRLETGKMQPVLRPCSISALVKQVHHTLNPIAREKGVDLSFRLAVPDIQTMLDESQISRVLINLGNNAIRHTAPSGKVQIVVARHGDQVCFHVTDSGEGIPPEYLQRIFERFVQVPGATQGGAGLGLSIAQRIVQNHGGEMSVKSELGLGSEFCFCLPIVSSGAKD
jgi:signal transduction histidine kinase